MKKTMKGFPVIIALLLTSCGVTTFQVYSFDLSEVERPNIADQSYGSRIVVTNLGKDSLGRYSYEDRFFTITWEPDIQQFRFLLTNKYDNSIQIPWDNASYVDYEKKASRVIHTGVRYINRYESQPATTIPGGSTLSDILIPADNIHFSSDGWDSRQIMPTKSVNAWTRSGLTKVQAVNPGYIGKCVSILLPVNINGVQNDYLFIFNIGQRSVDSGELYE
jgi:hypothetical protein